MDAQEGILGSAIFQEENAVYDLAGALVGARLGSSREIIVKSVDEGRPSLRETTTHATLQVDSLQTRESN